MILARSTKTNARRKECVIEEISAKISLTLEAECTITGIYQLELLGVICFVSEYGTLGLSARLPF